MRTFEEIKAKISDLESVDHPSKELWVGALSWVFNKQISEQEVVSTCDRIVGLLQGGTRLGNYMENAEYIVALKWVLGRFDKFECE